MDPFSYINRLNVDRARPRRYTDGGRPWPLAANAETTPDLLGARVVDVEPPGPNGIDVVCRLPLAH